MFVPKVPPVSPDDPNVVGGRGKDRSWLYGTYLGGGQTKGDKPPPLSLLT